MTVPFYPWTVWIWAGFDPALIVVAVYLGWKADQFGKCFIAAIIAFAIAVLFSWAVSAAGIPWPAPITHDGPTFFTVRAVAALLWAMLGYGARYATRRRA
ncbi:hypothetical protein [Methylobacterium sp. J-067]|uniref:hypothetical protein n=1 Tax=Methylobacterium sp. J-067 TaxID=2836648 RepID=UPI001FB98189|nr:hypothetical protein [Methylobacterium sp. J-067]MCJ2025924.1 hypothetical protein [Methylobacterium sp. J-067]